MSYTPPTFVNGSPPALNAANMQALANAAALALQPTRSTTAPTSPGTGQFWEDSTTSPATLKMWNGTTWEVVSSAGIASVDGVSNAGGNVDLISGTNMTITPDDTANTITFDASLSTGAITGTAKVDTTAALKAIDTTNATNYPTGTTYLVLGYYAAGDRAGTRTYRLNRSSSVTDNGGTIIAPTTGTGRWELMCAPDDYNVCHFGAHGDNNAADDAPFFQKALDALSAQPTGKLYVPPGMYNFDTTVTTETNYGVLIQGAGSFSINDGTNQTHGSSIRARSLAAGNALFSFRPLADATQSGVVKHFGPTFAFMNFRDNSATVRSCDGVIIRELNRATFLNCSFYQLRDAVVIKAEQAGYGEIAAGAGTLGDASWIHYIACHWKNCLRCIYVNSSGNQNVIGGSMYGPGPTVSGSRGVKFSGGSHHWMAGTKVEEVEIGIETQAGGGVYHGIRSEDCQNFMRIGVISGAANTGSFNIVSDVYVAVNTVTGGTGIEVQTGCDGNVIGHRTFKGTFAASSKVIVASGTNTKVMTQTNYNAGYTE